MTYNSQQTLTFVSINLKSSKRFAVALLIACLLLPIPTIAAQQQDRTIKQESWRNEPVRVAKLKVKGRRVGLGQKFPEDNDWFKELTVSVRNTSVKVITYLSVKLTFIRPDDETAQSPPLIHSLTYGRNPSLPKVTASIQPKPIAPGETVDISLSNEWYDALKRSLQEIGYPISIKQMNLSLEEVVFDDETIWMAGDMWRRDPNNSGRLILVEQRISRATNPRVDFLKLNFEVFDADENLLFSRLTRTKPLSAQSQCGSPSHPFYTRCGTMCEVKNYEALENPYTQTVRQFRAFRNCVRSDSSGNETPCGGGEKTEATDIASCQTTGGGGGECQGCMCPCNSDGARRARNAKVHQRKLLS